MDYILRDINIEFWSEVKAKATLERKAMREVIFESLRWHMAPAETTLVLAKRKRGKRGRRSVIGLLTRCMNRFARKINSRQAVRTPGYP